MVFTLLAGAVVFVFSTSAVFELLAGAVRDVFIACAVSKLLAGAEVVVVEFGIELLMFGAGGAVRFVFFACAVVKLLAGTVDVIIRTSTVWRTIVGACAVYCSIHFADAVVIAILFTGAEIDVVITCTVDVIVEAGAVLFAIITGAVRWAINFAGAEF